MHVLLIAVIIFTMSENVDTRLKPNGTVAKNNTRLKPPIKQPENNQTDTQVGFKINATSTALQTTHPIEIFDDDDDEVNNITAFETISLSDSNYADDEIITKTQTKKKLKILKTLIPKLFPSKTANSSDLDEENTFNETLKEAFNKNQSKVLKKIVKHPAFTLVLVIISVFCGICYLLKILLR